MSNARSERGACDMHFSITLLHMQKNNACHNKALYTLQIRRLIDWGIMALSAQTGYMMPLKSMLRLKN